jgi:hypothetical protein
LVDGGGVQGRGRVGNPVNPDLLTLVGVWAIFFGVAEIFAAFSLRQATKRVQQLVD